MTEETDIGLNAGQLEDVQQERIYLAARELTRG
jgi:hypothetical protein